MHRSGTSVTTNLLNAFGVPLSDDLMEPTAHNAKGYFESKEISRLHDAILATMGMDWKTSSMFVPFPKEWRRAPAIAEFREQLAQIALRELNRYDGLWGFKDPRTARLLPVWLDIIEQLGFDARFVLATRHPNEVAKSLQSRDGIDPLHSEIMWLEHNADVIANLGKKLHAIVDYRYWMETPVDQATYMIERLGLPWSGTRADIEAIANRVVDIGLRHHVTSEDTFKLPFTAPMYALILRRDIQQLASLTEVLNISRGFAQVMLSEVCADFQTKLERAAFNAQAQIQQLQSELNRSQEPVSEV